jgi:hypothetical protein
MRKIPKNLIGMKFGKVLVIGIFDFDKDRWLCKCDCGREIVRGRYSFFGKKSPVYSCGCSVKRRSLINLIGNKYGRLTVVEISKKVSANGRSYWVCKCDCGNTTIVRGSHLKNGSVQSCGCYSDERRLKGLLPGEAGFNSLFSEYRKGARNKKLNFSLSKEEFKILVTGNCFYCGQGPSQLSKSSSEHSIFLHNGVDRVDNSRGYESGNVVSCCSRCNRMKCAYSQQDFIEHCGLIYKRHFNHI